MPNNPWRHIKYQTLNVTWSPMEVAASMVVCGGADDDDDDGGGVNEWITCDTHRFK